MLKFRFVLTLWSLHMISCHLAITTENSSDNLHELKYCLKKSSHPRLRECLGRTAISFLQRFEEKDNFTVTTDFIASKDEAVAGRSLVNFLDTDPVDLRGILENAGAVFSQRSLEFHMDSLYPGLMFKIGPSADANSVAQFLLDPTMDERNFNYEEASTSRILTKQYLLPFLLGLKFNLVALVPILFTVICLLLKKSLFIAKLVIYISSVLGVGGIASSLGSFGGAGGLGGLFSAPLFAGPPPLHSPLHGIGGGGHLPGHLGLYPGKHTVFSQYDQDELQHNSPYKRQDRKVVFEKPRENINRHNNNIRSTIPSMLATPAPDRFYDFEDQMLMHDHSGKVRQSSGKLGPSAYRGNDEEEEELAGVISVSPNHRFQTSDSSGWKVVNLRA